MSGQDERPTPNDARAALGAVEEKRRAGLRAAAPPRWLIALAALYAGGMVAIQVLDETARDFVMVGLGVLFFGGLIVFRRRALAMKRRFGGQSVWPALGLIAAAVAVMVGVIVAVDVAQHRYGYGWAPLPGGALLFALIMCLGEFKRGSLRADGA